MLTTSEQAVTRKRQHTKPCHDCPWRVDALPGWLGGTPATQWVQIAMSDHPEPCHVIKNQQCAGLAIFRANICKTPRDKSVLRLPADRTRVFALWSEFLMYHSTEVAAKVFSKAQKILKRGRKSGKVES